MMARYIRVNAVAAVVGLILMAGCAHGPAARSGSTSVAQSPVSAEAMKVFELKAISPQQAAALLTELGIGKVSVVPERNAVAIAGPASVQHRASVVLNIVDMNEPYAVRVLAPLSLTRDIPSNDQIAEALGHIAICTFADPVRAESRPRGIVDIQGESVVAVIPARFQQDIAKIVRSYRADSRPVKTGPKSIDMG
jgi:hypothetical protein